MTHTLPTVSTAPKTNRLRVYWLEAKYEFLKALRMPRYTVFTLVFPLMFYVLFSLVMNYGPVGNVQAATYMLATYGAFGVIGVSLFGFGSSIAAERGQGWMRLKRASPMPPLAYFTAKLFMALLFSTIVILALFTLAAVFGGVNMPFTTWLALFATLLLGALPFGAMGLMFGYLSGPNSAVALLNLTYMPMAFFSGLWVPINVLPKFVQTIAPFLPAYHYSQLALSTIGGSINSTVTQHVLVLLAFTAAFLIVAVILYRRDAGKTYG
jgi:ABC-2 type transport system permease protein